MYLPSRGEWIEDVSTHHPWRDPQGSAGAIMGSRKKKTDKIQDTDAGRRFEDHEHIELREEELRVEKERVEAGEVRLRKEVVKENKTVDVPITREEVVVEKRSVGGRRPAAGDIGEDEEISIPVMEEQVQVEKTPVVREEVSLKKQQVQDSRQVSDTVKREEAWVDTAGTAEVRTNSARQWQGKERRRRNDPSFAGQDRRMASF
jgi:uncharacterized protein (TIGR02271 family)